MDDYERALAEVEGAPTPELARALYAERLFPLAQARLAGRGGDARLLVLTVGGQPWSVALSLGATPAPRVLALHTSESEPSLDRALALLPGPRPEVLRRAVDKADSTAVYERIREALDALGVPGDETVIDFTSGTKAMTAGASTFAGFRGLRQVYIASRPLRGAAGGLFGDEELHRVDHPLVASGDPARRDAERSFDAQDFGVAERGFRALHEARAPGYHYEARAALAVAYRAWDALAFGAAAAGLDAVAESLSRAVPRNVPREPLRAQVSRLRAQAQACRTLARATGGGPDAAAANALLRWLLAGARRAERTRLDLSALLLYRALELALQRRLVARGYSAGDFRPEDPEAFLRRYNALAGPKHAVASLPRELGLARAWTALQALDDPAIAACGVARERLLGVVTARNDSILAHGFGTISEATVGGLREVARRVAAAVSEADGLPLPAPTDEAFDFVRLGDG